MLNIEKDDSEEENDFIKRHNRIYNSIPDSDIPKSKKHEMKKTLVFFAFIEEVAEILGIIASILG